MTSLSEWQIEYIKLIYGLAFIILATVCFSMSRTASRRLPWIWLGLFGIIHGLSNWILCFITSYNDNFFFPFVITLLLGVSFICLAEFGRAGTVRIQGKGPRRWVLIPLLVLAVLAGVVKPGCMQATVLYVLGLAGGLLAARALSLASRNNEPNINRQLKTGSVAMGIYALFAGFLVLPAPFMSELFGSDTYLNAFSFLCQVIRTFFVLWLSVAIWAYSQAQFLEDNDQSNHAARSKYALMTAAILLIALCLGWNATRYLEYNARENLQNRSIDNVTAISNQLLDDLEETDHAATAIAEDRMVVPALLSGDTGDLERANQVLDNYHKVLEDPICYLIDIKGNVVASSNRYEPDSYVGQNYGFRPYSRQALAGEAGHYFALGVTSGERGYYASYPVRDEQHNIIGAAVVKRKIHNLESAFQQYSLCFFIDPHGVVFLSSQPDMLYMSLWPLNEEIQQALIDSRQFGSGRSRR